MSLEPPFPTLDDMMRHIGEAGRRMAEIGACEGAAGNISVFANWPVEVLSRFPLVEEIELPVAAPALAGGTLLVTGSGIRLREVYDRPLENLGVLQIAPGGTHARLYTAPSRVFTRLTSELNSHLAVHNDQVAASGTNYHALVHAQPVHLTYLSHIPRYRDPLELNRRLFRWQPETIMTFPQGVAVLPFIVPGSAELMAATTTAMRHHHLVVWSKHGVMARSDTSVKRAADLIEYLETSAHYEALNLSAGEPADGLQPDEIRAIARALGMEQTIF
ncbi:MAG: class II aldolase/adducin family protein [Roseiflexus sp.]|nr:class II aldolase/adducin family protein [Roseiflexus sp.]MCS7289404.1 class II aldolase/adducin family protein [Roseiflexus sp.]MDW8148149.1 class II aldolase/adducin family protein [Roseiflexaceae bacterium]MDW8233981.1 class II aldolase/adducin family protein [Roseiflexaceae bacterium]